MSERYLDSRFWQAHGRAVQLRTTRTSTRVSGADGADTDRANRSPSCTRGGTTRRTGWRPSASPLPSHGSHGSDQISPRPPQATQSLRTGTSSGTVTPSNASRGDRCSSADSRRATIAFGRRGDETRAHPLDRGVQRRKIDRDFVVEPSVRGARAASPARAWRRVRRHEGESNSSASTLVR